MTTCPPSLTTIEGKTKYLLEKENNSLKLYRSMSIQRERESILRKRDKPFECISEED